MARSLTELLSGPFIWGAGGAKLSPEDIAMRREEAGELAKSAVDFSPVGHWSQGLGRVANALMAGMDYRTANAAQKESDAFSNGALDEAFGASPAPQMSPVATALAAGEAAPAVLPQPGASSEIAASRPFSGGQQGFIDTLLPAAIEEGKRTGIDPRIIVAQAAQETGWGRSAPGNNFFGIKSHGQGGGNSLMTTEYVNGQPVQQRDSFRAYGSPQESVRGYGDFILQNPRYEKLRAAQGLDNQLAELQASGYATDPNYGRSVGAIARGIQLPSETASLDPSIGMPPSVMAIENQTPRSGYVDPMVSSPNYDPVVAGLAEGPMPSPGGAEVGSAPLQAGADPRAATAPQVPPPQQVAQAPQDRGIMAALSGGQGQGAGYFPPAPSSAPTRVGGVDQRILRALADPRLNQQGRSVLQVLAQQQVAEQRAAQERQAERENWLFQQQYQEQANARDPYRQAQIDKLRRDAANPKGDETFFGNPVAIQNPDGSIGYGQIGNKGTFRPIQLGDGQTFAPPTKTIDTGTETILVDQAGNVISRTIKENRKEAADKAAGANEGKVQAEKQAEYDSITSKMPGLYGVVERLSDLAKKATYTMAGRAADFGIAQLGMEPRDAAVARAEYTAIVDNQILPLLRDTFGAQFTNEEGLRLARTLGDADKSPTEKAALLRAFIEQKERDIQALGTQLNKAGGSVQKSDRSPVSIGGYTIEQVD